MKVKNRVWSAEGKEEESGVLRRLDFRPSFIRSWVRSFRPRGSNLQDWTDGLHFLPRSLVRVIARAPLSLTGDLTPLTPLYICAPRRWQVFTIQRLFKKPCSLFLSLSLRRLLQPATHSTTLLFTSTTSRTPTPTSTRSTITTTILATGTKGRHEHFLFKVPSSL